MMLDKNLTIQDVHQGLGQKKFSCQELVKDYFNKIKKNQLNTFITLNDQQALEEAKKVDQKIKANKPLGLLEGVPLAIKDTIMTKGLRTTAGSKILENYNAVYDATVIQKLKKEGVIILGKTNCDEFAMGSSNENSYFGPVKNPWDQTRVPGGSSGGSAAAVAEPADECVFSLGSDTGGSIRQPAAFCGVVGLKPTYGRVSRWGLIALASSLDQIGPLTKNVEDCATTLEIIAGIDNNDQTTLDKKIPQYSKEIKKDNKKLIIGLVKECFNKGLDQEIADNIEQVIKKLGQQKFKIKEVSLPTLDYALPGYYIIQPAEASANLARYDGLRYGLNNKNIKNLWQLYQQNRGSGFGSEVRRRIIIGTFVLSTGYIDAYYKKALAVRQIIREEFQKVFQQVNLLIMPTTPTSAFKLKEKINDPLAMYLSDIYTVSINIAGLPALSLPIGFTKQKLPIGMQVIGNYFEELKILKLAKAIEQLLS